MNWSEYTDYFKDLNLSDIPGMAQWAMGATRPQPEFGGWGPEGWKAQAGWQQEQMDANPMAFLGMTKVIGAPGGNRLIQSLSDKTGQLLGELGYRDVPGKGAIIQNFRSKAPDATKELYERFNQEMGPLLNNVRVQGNIRPEAWGSVKGALDKGIYNEYPQLQQQWQRALQESQGRYPNVRNPQPARWETGSGWAVKEPPPASPLAFPDAAPRRAYVYRPDPNAEAEKKALADVLRSDSTFMDMIDSIFSGNK